MLAFFAEGAWLAFCTQATPLFDKLVFSKVKARLGGRVKLIVSGGAPLAGHVEEFLKVTMCAPVVQVCLPSWQLSFPDSQRHRSQGASVPQLMATTYFYITRAFTHYDITLA